MNPIVLEPENTAAEARAETVPRPEPSGQDRLVILLVDDQLENLAALEAILQGPRHSLLRASSGREALRYLLHQDVALVLLDVRMPVMDGFETARLIRERERSKATPIIFLTAANDGGEKEFEGYSAGGVDYIVKPFIPEILRAKVEVFLNLATARRQLEEEIGRRRLAEKKLERVAKRLRRRAAELEAANEELEAFAYSASHDLRAPLRHISGFVNMLREEPEETSDEGPAPYLERIAESADKMNRLLDDLLAFSKVGRAEMSMAPVDLESLLEEVIEGLEPETRDRSIIWRRARLPVVIGDRAMLRQVLVNLLSNALKYTIHSDPAEIGIGHHVAGSKATIFIRDNGAGFNMKYSKKLFKVFQRLHLGSEFDGTGIGLANVQRIIERHGGRVWGEGRIGNGATFRFSLPLAGPSSETAQGCG